jgi:hypothetical protein
LETSERTAYVFRAAIVAVTVTAALAFAATGAAQEKTKWYWSPGYCKSVLIHNGVAFDDGRTFNIERAYCIGVGGQATCEWWYGERQYTTFTAFVRSYDGTVRVLLNFKTTGHGGFRFYDSRLLARYASPSQFASTYGPAASRTAASEQAKGCHKP